MKTAGGSPTLVGVALPGLWAGLAVPRTSWAHPLLLTGLLHHKGDKTSFSSRFGQGSIIGVHLDTWHGTLTFFKNRKCIGEGLCGSFRAGARQSDLRFLREGGQG